MVGPGPETNLHRQQIINFAFQNRLPAMYPTAMCVIDGGLLSYGAHLRVLNRRAGYYVDKVLKGTKPSDLPAEQSMTAALFIKIKTANVANKVIR